MDRQPKRWPPAPGHPTTKWNSSSRLLFCAARGAADRDSLSEVTLYRRPGPAASYRECRAPFQAARLWQPRPRGRLQDRSVESPLVTKRRPLPHGCGSVTTQGTTRRTAPIHRGSICRAAMPGIEACSGLWRDIGRYLVIGFESVLRHEFAAARLSLRLNIEEGTDAFADEDKAATVGVGFHQIIHAGSGQEILETLRFLEALGDIDQRQLARGKRFILAAHGTTEPINL